MKVKTFKKNSTREENTSPSTTTDEKQSDTLTEEMVCKTSREREARATKMTNQTREGIAYLPVVFIRPSVCSFLRSFVCLLVRLLDRSFVRV